MASIMGVLAFCQGLLSTIIPPELRSSLLTLLRRVSHYFSTYCYFDIVEIDGVNTNELYTAVQLYLSTSSAVSSAGRVTLTRSLNSSAVTFGLAHNDTLFDTFDGVVLQWEHVVTQRPGSQAFSWRPVPDEKRVFSLRVKKTQKKAVLNRYLDHIMDRAADVRRRNLDRYLYTNARGGACMDSTRPGFPWESVPFKHPSTFETLAIDPNRKSEIMSDLRDFAAGESFYRATGRAWKRGYLLFGPPGTGKSSMIAAMANFLNYDIYDLELSEVGSNSELRKLLMKTTPKSIIVIEDIDCSVNLTTTRNRKQSGRAGPGHDPEEGSGPTLSGLLNFTDGLWSCCGSERIFVFTTNHAEKLDPALLRSGRMDMHIHMSYCSFPALKILMKNYLGIEDGDLSDGKMDEFEEVVEKAKMTPADVSEVLIRYRREKMRAVMELLEEMKRRRGGERKCGRRNDNGEEEEHEKRELEMHNEIGEKNDDEKGEMMDDAFKNGEDDEKKFN